MNRRSGWQSVFNRVEVAIRAAALDDERLDEELAEFVRVDIGKKDDVAFAELLAHARQLSAQLRAEEMEWKDVTVNDRIDGAFAELNSAGIVSLQNAGTTMSDGWSDVNEIATARKARGDTPRGAVFFHEQDAGRGVAGKGLLLAFGAYVEEPREKVAADRVIAREVVATLQRHGVSASWDGAADSRIAIAPFRWQKRRSTKAPPYPLPRDDNDRAMKPRAAIGLAKDADEAAEETRLAQAHQIVERLLEAELLELVSSNSRPRLERDLQTELVEPPDSLEGLTEQLLAWFEDQKVVAEIFADHEAMIGILKDVTPPILGA